MGVTVFSHGDKAVRWICTGRISIESEDYETVFRVMIRRLFKDISVICVAPKGNDIFAVRHGLNSRNGNDYRDWGNNRL